MGPVPQDLLSFSVIPGRCFRMVQPDGSIHPSHCEEPVTVQGQFTDGAGKRWTVSACERHAAALDRPQSAR